MEEIRLTDWPSIRREVAGVLASCPQVPSTSLVVTPPQKHLFQCGAESEGRSKVFS